MSDGFSSQQNTGPQYNSIQTVSGFSSQQNTGPIKHNILVMQKYDILGVTQLMQSMTTIWKLAIHYTIYLPRF